MNIIEAIKEFFNFLATSYGNNIFVAQQNEGFIPKIENETKTTKDKFSTLKFQTDIFSRVENWINSRNLEELENNINKCQKCPLGRTRTKFVFGEGNPNPEIMLIGEAPGADEDLQGLPFVGRAGQLLTKILASINLLREDVYICNILKCRPPNNRKPTPSEIQTCIPYLYKQIDLLKPSIILTLGSTAIEGLFGITEKMVNLHGKELEFNGITVIPTYHPAALLRNPSLKRVVWEDIQILLKVLSRKKGKS
ncbi:MAG: uracil-DNA glycosylase [Candidatus Kapaibacteriales bacterium]